jgi:NADPH2:quinone reductase
MKAFELNTYNIGGAFAEYCVTDVAHCIPISDSFTFEEAASFIVNPITAVCMVERIKKLKSKAVIITAAAS